MANQQVIVVEYESSSKLQFHNLRLLDIHHRQDGLSGVMDGHGILVVCDQW